MTAHVNDSVIDDGLSSLKSAARYLYICSQEPTTYTEASSTYALGSKDAGAGNIFPGAIAAGTNGRKVTTLDITDGTVSSTGTATHWAVTDASNLLAVGALSASKGVTSPGSFTLPPLDITVRSQ